VVTVKCVLTYLDPEYTVVYTIVFMQQISSSSAAQVLATFLSKTICFPADSFKYSPSISTPGEHLGADLPDILHIGDDKFSAIHNHSE